MAPEKEPTTGEVEGQQVIAEVVEAAEATAPPIVEEAPPADSAPKRGRGRPRKTDSAPTSKPRPKATATPNREQKVLELLGFASLTLYGLGSVPGREKLMTDGQIIGSNAPNVAKAIDMTCREHPGFAAAVDALISGSSYAVLVSALAPVLIGIAANHGLMPSGMGPMVEAAMSPDATDNVAA